MGHIRMMAAVQPFLSGAISKTVNLPTDCTVEDIEDAYIQAWKLGLKAIAVYRDGCKRTQPLSTNLSQATSNGSQSPRLNVDPLELLSPEERRLVEALRVRKTRPAGPPMANRYKLPDERASFTHKFSIGGHEGYITVGMYQDGSPGEIFVRMAKEGSVIAGLMDSFATVHLARAPARRAAPRPDREVQGHALRALGLHRQPGNPDRDVDHGLPVPLARDPVPDGRRRRIVERHPAARAAQLDLPKVPLLAKDFISVEVKAGASSRPSRSRSRTARGSRRPTLRRATSAAR